MNLVTMSIFTYLFSSFRITVPFVASGATQVQFQPWYLFWTLPLVALIPETTLIIASILIAIGATLRYFPYLYYGVWSQPGTLTFMQTVTVVPIILASIIFLAKIFRAKKK